MPTLAAQPWLWGQWPVDWTLVLHDGRGAIGRGGCGNGDLRRTPNCHEGTIDLALVVDLWCRALSTGVVCQLVAWGTISP